MVARKVIVTRRRQNIAELLSSNVWPCSLDRANGAVLRTKECMTDEAQKSTERECDSAYLAFSIKKKPGEADTQSCTKRRQEVRTGILIT
jgi:hypothetical protein